MRTTRAALLLALLVVGCDRLFQTAVPLPPPQLLALGQVCAIDDDCQSLVCEDGLCCAGVCGACERCDLSGRRGVCSAVADGDAPRTNDAGYPACMACKAGRMQVADLGTDPYERCGAGKSCGVADLAGSIACLAELGGSCTRDADCAEGTCLGGRCGEITTEELPAALRGNGANFRAVGAVYADEVVEAFVLTDVQLTHSSQGSTLVTAIGRTLLHRRRGNGASWTFTDLPSDSNFGGDGVFLQFTQPVALGRLGDDLVVALADYAYARCPSTGRCGLHAFRRNLLSGSVRHEVLDGSLDTIRHLSLRRTAADRLTLVATKSDTASLWVASPDGWSREHDLEIDDSDLSAVQDIGWAGTHPFWAILTSRFVTPRKAVLFDVATGASADVLPPEGCTAGGLTTLGSSEAGFHRLAFFCTRSDSADLVDLRQITRRPDGTVVEEAAGPNSILFAVPSPDPRSDVWMAVFSGISPAKQRRAEWARGSTAPALHTPMMLATPPVGIADVVVGGTDLHLLGSGTFILRDDDTARFTPGTAPVGISTLHFAR